MRVSADSRARSPLRYPVVVRGFLGMERPSPPKRRARSPTARDARQQPQLDGQQHARPVVAHRGVAIPRTYWTTPRSAGVAGCARRPHGRRSGETPSASLGYRWPCTLRVHDGSKSVRPMIRHVLAIYRPTRTGRSALGKAVAIAYEHGAQLTVAVVTGGRGGRACCSHSAGRWGTLLREAALCDLDEARAVLGPASIWRSWRGAVRARSRRPLSGCVAISSSCPVARSASRGGLARAFGDGPRRPSIGVRRG